MRNRREILKAALAGGAFAANLNGWATAWAQEQPFKPEPGAKLQFLRWGKFLDAEDQATKANIAAFSQATGTEVVLTSESMDDIQAKVAVAANVGSGADVVWALHTTCAYRKSHPAILMVQSAQDRAADEIPGPPNAARNRGILVQ